MKTLLCLLSVLMALSTVPTMGGAAMKLAQEEPAMYGTIMKLTDKDPSKEETRLAWNALTTDEQALFEWEWQDVAAEVIAHSWEDQAALLRGWLIERREEERAWRDRERRQALTARRPWIPANPYGPSVRNRRPLQFFFGGNMGVGVMTDNFLFVPGRSPIYMLP